MDDRICLGGIGGALVDYVLPLTEAEFAALHLPVERGSALRLPSREFARIIAAMDFRHIRTSAGGSVCNTLRHFASFPRCASRLFSAVGNDDASKFLLSALEAAHVDTAAVQAHGTRATDCCLAIVTPDGERTMLSCIDAGTALAPADFPEEAFSGLALLHFEGYMMRFPGMVGEILLRLAGKCGLSFDLGSIDLIRQYRAHWKELLQSPQLRFLFGNRSEFHVLFECDCMSDLQDALAMQCHPGLQCVMTDGANGAFWISAHTPVIHGQAVRISNVVDTIGAGDSFIAGFLASMLHDAPIEDALASGAQIAARIVSAAGA